MVKYIFVTALAFCAFQLQGQTLPAELKGSEARAWMKVNYYDRDFAQLTYSQARRKMFAYIVNTNDSIECVYSGLRLSLEEGDESTAYPAPFNTEHVVPQSLFGSNDPMRSDIYILQPAFEAWNSLRSNYPFFEIDDEDAQQWIYQDRSYTSMPDSEIDFYSEYVSFGWEPRESRKGDVARAIMYFFTMYPQYEITSAMDTSELCNWHEQDSVDAFEAKRNTLTEVYQGNLNPYIAFPHWANQAWGCSVPAPPIISGLEVLKDNFARIYPNPGNGLFRIELKGDVSFPVTAELLDTKGRLAESDILFSNAGDLQYNSPPGTYFIVLKNASGEALGYIKVSISR